MSAVTGLVVFPLLSQRLCSDILPIFPNLIHNNPRHKTKTMGQGGTSRVQVKILTALILCLMVQLYLSALNFHNMDDDTHSLLAPVHVLTPEELTGNPEPGRILCPSPLYPVYDRIVFQKNDRRIPRMIHVSMKSRCLPEDFYLNTEKWKAALPRHSFYFHDDDAVDKLINLPWPEFPQLKLMMRCVLFRGAMKIDVWRILVVYVFGGLYCDADMYPTKLMTETYPIALSDDSFFLSDAWNRPSQWFFGMSKQHPIAYYTMFEIFKRLQELLDLRSPKVVFVTGPDALKHGYANALGWKVDDIFKEGTHACREELGNRTATKKNKSESFVKTLSFGDMVPWNSTVNVTRRQKNEWLHGVQHWIFKNTTSMV
ncbi:hypothetical protein ACHAW5_008533 [Stephanodiscus triporus]|uniref:Alpha-1,4-N-acetylglucosaminyltransferase n=1 Tax=Stephanodiscus triporus TaxID=2934178 RepID=A0ABD3NU09_9STRA